MEWYQLHHEHEEQVEREDESADTEERTSIDVHAGDTLRRDAEGGGRGADEVGDSIFD